MHQIISRIKLFLLIIAYHKRGNRLQRYGLPIILLTVTILIKYEFDEYFTAGAPFILIPFVILLSAWYGGFGPGIFATVLSLIVADLFFLPNPSDFLKKENIVRTVIFIVEGLLMSIITEAQKQAEIQKNQFIGFAGHELRNPLMVIKGYTNLIHNQAKKKKEETITKYAEIINAYSQTITLLINDLLDITSIETGKFIYRDRLFPIYDLMKNVIRHEQLVTKTHEIQLKGKTKKNLLADPYRIEQVITNLLSNAKKYSPDGGKIIVSIKNITRGVEISIRDFGIGISKNNHKKIFILSYRAVPIHEHNIKGSGFGLYICTQIVKHYGGKIWYTSILKKGTTFHVQLYNTNILHKLSS